LDSFPNLQLNDLGQLQIGPDPSSPSGTIVNTYQLAEALTWTKSSHTLKFGIEGRKYISPQTFTQRVRGDYEYTETLSCRMPSRIRSPSAATEIRSIMPTSPQSTGT
jgi:hypothetical protein